MSEVVIVDLGYGNIGSIENALARAGAQTRRSCDPEVIGRAERLLLPGVGAAAHAMSRIAALGLADVLRDYRGTALGICLGMHLLFEHSEEGDVPTLGLIPGKVRRLGPSPGVAVPHMGWSRIETAPDVSGLKSGDYVYFAHSYAAEDGPATLARAHHGTAIPALVRHGRWTGAQFHPERSGAVGARFLQGWLSQ